MTKEELEKATGQELIDERDYCGVDGYYGDYLDNVNAEMHKRFNRLAELEEQIADIKANCDLAIEGRDIKIMELEQENNKLLDVINNQDVKIADLEQDLKHKKIAIQTRNKRIADLEETLKTYNGCGDWDNDFHACRVYLQHEEWQKQDKQLEQAKKIIKEMLPYMPKENIEGVYEIVTHAEEFIKEIEK